MARSPAFRTVPHMLKATHSISVVDTPPPHPPLPTITTVLMSFWSAGANLGCVCTVPPPCLLKQMGDTAGCNDGNCADSDTSSHSPQIGWAADGFPVYGPRGPSGTMMKTCTVTGGTYGTAVCTDDCGGYYNNGGTIDNFVYRYYMQGNLLQHELISLCALQVHTIPASRATLPLAPHLAPATTHTRRCAFADAVPVASHAVWGHSPCHHVALSQAPKLTVLPAAAPRLSPLATALVGLELICPPVCHSTLLAVRVQTLDAPAPHAPPNPQHQPHARRAVLPTAALVIPVPIQATQCALLCFLFLPWPWSYFRS